MKTFLLILSLCFLFPNISTSCSCRTVPKFFNNIYVKNGINCIAVLDSFSLEVVPEGYFAQTGHFTLIDTLSKMEISVGQSITVFGSAGADCGAEIEKMTIGDTFLLSLSDHYYEQILKDTFFLGGCGDVYVNLNDSEYLDWTMEELKDRIDDITSSTKDLVLPQLVTVFPNPASQKVYIQAEEITIRSIQVYDNLGKLMFNLDGLKTDSQAIVLSTLQAGIYFLQINTLEGTTYKKIIKE